MMRMLALVVALSCAPVTPFVTSNPSRVLAPIEVQGRKETLRVEVVYSMETLPGFSRRYGSGVRYGDRVITAEHVITRAVFVLVNELPFKVDSVAPGTDVAFLRAVRPSDMALLPASMPLYSGTVYSGMRVWCFGRTSGSFAATLERPLYRPREEYSEPFLMATPTVRPGDSGGPVFDDNGALIGIVTAYLRHGNSTYIAPLQKILDR